MGMNISDFFDMDVLIQILTDWSTATGIGIIAVDEKGEYMMDPIGWKDFCMKYTRGTKEGLRRCVKCDQEGQGVYFCHAGLIDFTADIKIGDHFIGKLVGGQVLPQPPDEEHFRNLAVELGIDPDEYIEALQDITVRTEEEIRASAKLLDEVVNIVVNSQYVRKKDEDLILIFDQEIDKASDLIREINGKSCELVKEISGQICRRSVFLPYTAACQRRGNRRYRRRTLYRCRRYGRLLSRDQQRSLHYI